MKKLKFIILGLLVFLLCSCRSHNYLGKYPDLYTVAINSVLWNNGHSYGADREIDSSIEVIEQDDYGRTMFVYYERYYAGAKLSFSALIISQYSSNGLVYYYEDYNFLILKQELFINDNQFSKEDFEKLKLLNDWNKKLNLSKCVNKEIICDKPKIPGDSKLIKDKIIEDYNLEDKRYNLFMDYLTSDAESNFIIYGSIILLDGEDDRYFVSHIKIQENGQVIINSFSPSNLYEYQQELRDFKIQHNWQS